MNKLTGILVLLFLGVTGVFATSPKGLVYSGETDWDPATGTLVFKSSGSMPNSIEEFFWVVPNDVGRVIINAGVTVTGGFRVPFRKQGRPLFIEGKDRATSIIYGTDVEQWTVKNGIADNEKWKYGAVNVLADAEVHVSNLTSQNPRGYNISGYATKAVIHVTGCNLTDTRHGNNNNSDGFIGSAGSSISDSLISTSDDGIKAYSDITITNVTIEQHRNGAPIQFGWGGNADHTTATIHNLTIVGVNPEKLYNMAPFTWENGNPGVRDVFITGLKINVPGQLYDESTQSWVPMGLLELKPKESTLNMTATNAELSGLPLGIRKTKGKIVINGADL